MCDRTVQHRAELEQLAAQRHGDPVLALRQVEQLWAQVDGDAESVGLLLWIQALLLHELVRWDEALELYQRAVNWAVNRSLAEVEVRARGNMAVLLMQLGRTAEAENQLATAERIATPPVEGLVAFLRAMITQRAGHHHCALARYDAAEPLLEAAGDETTVEVLHLNRGLALIYLGDLEGAGRELRRTEAAANRLKLIVLAGMAAHNLGFLESRRGHLADALAAFDRAEARYRELTAQPRQMPVLHSDRAEVLLQAGLVTDARRSAQNAVRDLQADGNAADLSEARLLLARACLASGDHDEAKHLAVAAARGFRANRRTPWVCQASFVARQIDHVNARLEGAGTRRLSQRFERVGADLIRHGWPVEGRDALVFAALASLRGADTSRAQELLGRVTGHRGRGAVQQRARLNLARAELLRASGQPDRASVAVRRGVADAIKVVEVTGSTEARMEALRFASELADLGIAIALEQGRGSGILRAIERRRSVASAVISQPGSARLTAGPALAGRPVSAGPMVAGRSRPSDRRLAVPKAADEAEIRDRSLRQRATGPGLQPKLAWRELRAASALGNLVYYDDTSGELRAVVVRGPTTRVVALGPLSAVEREMKFLTFELERWSALGAANSRAFSGVQRQGQEMERLLVAPLGLGPGPLTVVSCAAIRTLRWGLLPAMADRDVTVVASGLDWLRARARPPIPAQPRVMLVSGPRLASRDREVAQIAELYPQATVLTGAAATVGNVLDGFTEFDIVHIAAHGLFREESPMFSRLELHDGPLTIYDLERLDQLPALVVLSACEAAASRLYPSGGALGTASALTALGARTVLAPLQRVPDDATCRVMARVHEQLAAGSTPARAIRLAAASAGSASDKEGQLTAGMFVVIGAG